MTAVERHTVDPRGETVAKHTAEMLEQVGRALSALESGNWSSFRDRLYAIREHSLIADMEMNGGRHPASSRETARLIKERLADSSWPRVITTFLLAEQPEEAR